MLSNISKIRGNRDVLVFASDLSKVRAPIGIEYTDLLAIQDQLENLSGKAIDIVLETPGGLGEVVEDIVSLIRGKYETVGMIILGYAKSAGTILATAGDEILMGKGSALGPMDGQLQTANGKRFSADAFLEGPEKIKNEVEETKKLNPIYIPNPAKYIAWRDSKLRKTFRIFLSIWLQSACQVQVQVLGQTF